MWHTSDHNYVVECGSTREVWKNTPQKSFRCLEIALRPLLSLNVFLLYEKLNS